MRFAILALLTLFPIFAVLALPQFGMPFLHVMGSEFGPGPNGYIPQVHCQNWSDTIYATSTNTETTIMMTTMEAAGPTLMHLMSVADATSTTVAEATLTKATDATVTKVPLMSSIDAVATPIILLQMPSSVTVTPATTSMISAAAESSANLCPAWLINGSTRTVMMSEMLYVFAAAFTAMAIL
ncbi:hypothetical protein C8J56DRAFT_935945 [Mycena floridula]|nr:hypothetical protein C8J56DRAFT_935945 [Mycena floridula]